MKLNCDLGEFADNNDAEIMPYLDFANIACGLHGSDPLTIKNTVRLAHQHQVIIGAHPSYPDAKNFGRCSMALSSAELIACVQYQIGALQALCSAENTAVHYVKPHGALYNDMMSKCAIFTDICHAIAALNNASKSKQPLALMIQATPEDDGEGAGIGKAEGKSQQYSAIAAQLGVTLWREAFADRNYQDSGLLVPRTSEAALLTQCDTVVERCQALLAQQPLRSINNVPLKLQIDTLCVHGDSPNALAMIKALRAALDQYTDGIKK